VDHQQDGIRAIAAAHRDPLLRAADRNLQHLLDTVRRHDLACIRDDVRDMRARERAGRSVRGCLRPVGA